MYIGLDIGTSSVKALLVSATGETLACASKPYPVHAKSGYELQPLEVWNAVCAVLAEVATYRLPIRGIGLSSLGEAAVVMDENYIPLGNSILPGDPRGTEEADAVSDPNMLVARTGLPHSATYTVYKLLWMAKHMPEEYSKIRHVMLFGDYIGFMLTGNAAISRSLASRTSAFDIHNNEFFAPFPEIDSSWFSTPVEGDTCIGCVKKALAEKLGLPLDIPVFAGGHDQPCAAAGCGVASAGMASDSIGTSECLTVHMGSRSLTAEQTAAGNFPSEPFLEHGLYGTIAYTHTAGRMVEWYLRSVLKSADPRAADHMAQRCGSEPSGLLVVPHLTGSGTPTMDPCSVGTIIGLTLSHDDAAIYRGILEGISYEMRLNLECLSDMGVHLSRVVANGGGANSPLWLQMKSDIYRLPISVPACRDASALGAAMSAAIGLGDFKSVADAAEALVHWTQTYYPQEESAQQYDRLYDQYKEVYQAVQKIRKVGKTNG